MDKVNEKALEELKKYRAENCHMLVPCMDQIAEVAQGFRLIVTPVFLRPHPKDKDIYPHETSHYNTKGNDWHKAVGKGQYEQKVIPENELVRVSGQGLEKLAQHVALVWDKPHVMIDKEFKGRQLCELAGAVRMPDGFSFYRMADAYGMDLEIVREQLAAQYSKDDQKWLIERDLLQKKANQTKLCISGARNRIIRKILGVDGTYTVASLAKPFIAVRVIPWLDMSDDYTRRLVTEMNVKQMAITSLFGGQMPEQKQIAAPESSAPAISYDASIPADKCQGDDVIDADVATTYHVGEPPEPPPPEAEQEPDSLAVDFQNSGPSEQCTILHALAKAKAYDLEGWLKKAKTTAEKLSSDKRMEMFGYLNNLPAAAPFEGGK